MQQLADSQAVEATAFLEQVMMTCAARSLTALPCSLGAGLRAPHHREQTHVPAKLSLGCSADHVCCPHEPELPTRPSVVHASGHCLEGVARKDGLQTPW